MEGANDQGMTVHVMRTWMVKVVLSAARALASFLVQRLVEALHGDDVDLLLTRVHLILTQLLHDLSADRRLFDKQPNCLNHALECFFKHR